MDSASSEMVLPQRRVWRAAEEEELEEEDWPRERSQSWTTFDEEANIGEEAW